MNENDAITIDIAQYSLDENTPDWMVGDYVIDSFHIKHYRQGYRCKAYRIGGFSMFGLLLTTNGWVHREVVVRITRKKELIV